MLVTYSWCKNKIWSVTTSKMILFLIMKNYIISRRVSAIQLKSLKNFRVEGFMEFSIKKHNIIFEVLP